MIHMPALPIRHPPHRSLSITTALVCKSRRLMHLNRNLFMSSRRRLRDCRRQRLSCQHQDQHQPDRARSDLKPVGCLLLHIFLRFPALKPSRRTAKPLETTATMPAAVMQSVFSRSEKPKEPVPVQRDVEMLSLEFVAEVTRDVVAQGVYSDRSVVHVPPSMTDTAVRWRPSSRDT